MENVDTATPPKLDLVRLMLAAALAPFLHKRTLVWFALPVVAAEAASNLLAEPEPPIALGFISTIAMLVLAIACHRVFVLGPHSTAGHGFQWWAQRVARFFGWGIVIGLVCAILAMPAFVYLVANSPSDVASSPADLPAHVQLLALVLALPAIYVLSRLSLVLPDVATTDAPGDLGKAWRLSSGNGLRLALVVGYLPLLVDTRTAMWLSGESPLIQTIRTLVVVYVLIFQVAVLSLAYRDLSQLGTAR